MHDMMGKCVALLCTFIYERENCDLGKYDHVSPIPTICQTLKIFWRKKSIEMFHWNSSK